MDFIIVLIIWITLVCTTGAVIIGISLHDIRQIKLDGRFQCNPNSRIWRKRPFISVVIDGEPTQECLDSLKHSNYHNMKIITDNEYLVDGLVLSIARNTILKRTAVSSAVRQLNGNPSLNVIEITAIYSSPKTLNQLFRLFWQITSMPFVSTRDGLNVTSARSTWPTISCINIGASINHHRIYAALSWLTKLANLATLLYVSYIAVILHQPEYLLLYLAVFGLWLLWTIVSYPYINLYQKAAYLFLSPLCLSYFVYRCSSAPFRFLRFLRHNSISVRQEQTSQKADSNLAEPA